MQQKLDLTIVKEIMRIPGEVRGAPLKTDAQFILREKREEGVKKIENKLKEIGYPIEYDKINSMAFYPVGLRVLSLLAIKEVFNFDDKKFEEMGRAAPQVSLVIKLFMRYFVSIRKTVREVPKMWRRHYTSGNLVPVKLDERQKTLILRLENFNLHPIFCVYTNGYFPKVIEFVVKAPVNCQETKCFFRGDKYHEYLLKW